MRILLLLALCSLRLAAAVTFDNFQNGGYSGAGVHSTTIVASGANLGCIVVTWYRSGSTGVPTCGGHAMTKAQTMSPTVCISAATVDTWFYFGAGLSAGTLTASVTASSESVLVVMTVNGANQTGQPDALGAFVSGTTSSNGFGIPITTAANNSLVIGAFCTAAANHASTSNAAWIGDGDPGDGVGLSFWRSTANVNPAGAFTLQGGANVPGYSSQGDAFSIAPQAASGGGGSFISNPSIIVVGP